MSFQLMPQHKPMQTHKLEAYADTQARSLCHNQSIRSDLVSEGKSVHWGSRLGVVLAVAGSAVGLGNFLRFPGQAAQNGAGAFMIPYFIALLLVGIPLAWAEWSMGRFAGVRGFHSAPGIFIALCRNRLAGYLGMFALLIPMMIYTYYVVIEAWCLGYAYYYLRGTLMMGSDPDKYSEFFVWFTGQGADGEVIGFTGTPIVIFVAITFFLNFFLIVRGLNNGIELFCKIAMPAMIICALCVLVRVLTLGTPELNTQAIEKQYTQLLEKSPDDPTRIFWLARAQWQNDQIEESKKTAAKGVQKIVDLGKEKSSQFHLIGVELSKMVAGNPPEFENQSTVGGLNFMWNPDYSKLMNPMTWLAAVGQIFFSLSVGFGVIINYASYMRKRDDIALSGATACVTNEFFEVCLGGLITLPAAFIFLGTAAATFSTFGLGFNALPNVFALMPGGQIFGFLWFFMLFLAAMTSSLSMLQPVNAFFEEGLGLKRYGSAILLGIVTIIGSGFVLYYSKDLTALDNIDFWCGTFLIVVLALIQSIIYGWVFGTERGMAELDRGALIRVPRFLSFVLKYVTPLFLAVILLATTVMSGPTYWENLQNDAVARRSVLLIGVAAVFLLIVIAIANYRWKRDGKFEAVFKDKDSE